MLIVYAVSRILIGLIFFISSGSKILSPRQFVENVRKYEILPTPIAIIYGWTLPYIELLAAFMLLTGWYSRFGALLVMAMTVSFIIAATIALVRHQNIACSCFGLLYRERISVFTLIRDFIILGISLFVFLFIPDINHMLAVFTNGFSYTKLTIFVLSVTAITIGIILVFKSIKLQLRNKQHLSRIH